MKCNGCGKSRPRNINYDPRWWSLRDYYGVSGWFCPVCYDKVSHDAYQQPKNPAEYLMMLLKLAGK